MAESKNTAQVIACYGKQAIISNDRGQSLINASIRRGAGKPLCGDVVDWTETGDGNAYITQIRKRQQTLLRADFRRHAKPLIANLDQFMVVIAPEPSYDLAMVDRALTISRLLKIPASLLINKTDLLSQEQQRELDSLEKRWQAFGLDSKRISVTQSMGLDELQQSLQGKTTALCGQSGVGKSSLCSALIPHRDIVIGALSEATGLGKHTTTSSTLYHLADNTEIIDTPGTRDFALWDMNEQELVTGFPELYDFAEQCKFSNCRHLHEPKCAVKIASENGDLDPLRYQTYLTAQSKNQQ